MNKLIMSISSINLLNFYEPTHGISATVGATREAWATTVWVESLIVVIAIGLDQLTRDNPSADPQRDVEGALA